MSCTLFNDKIVKHKLTYIFLIAILLISCSHNQTIPSDSPIFDYQAATIIKSSDLILDTLVFNEDMNNNSLIEKYTFGKSELMFYRQFVSENQILQEQILVDENTKTEIVYLGKLTDLNNHNFYHVITSFKVIGIGEIESPRGVSDIAFLDEDMENAIIYRMGMPDELPIKVEDKILYFNHEFQEIGISIFGGLPPILCIPIIGCN